MIGKKRERPRTLRHFAVLASIFLCTIVPDPVASSELPGATERTYPYPQSGVVLGQGWSSRFNRPTPGVCIDFEPATIPGHETTIRIERVSSKTDLLKKLSLSVKAGYSGAFSASAALRFVKSASFKTDSQQLLARVVINLGSSHVSPGLVTEYSDEYKSYIADLRSAQIALLNSNYGYPKDRNGTGLTSARSYDEVTATGVFDGAANALASPQAGIDTVSAPSPVTLAPKFEEILKSSPKDFELWCGDSFVSHLQRGAELNALLDFSSVEKETREKLILNFSAGGFGAKISGNRTTSEDESLDFESIRVDVLQIGGALAPSPTSIDEFLATVQSFAAGVDNMSGLPNGFRVSTSGYETVRPNFNAERQSDRMNLAYLAYGIFSDIVEKYENVVLDFEEDAQRASLLTFPVSDREIEECYKAANERKSKDQVAGSAELRGCGQMKVSRPLRDIYLTREQLTEGKVVEALKDGSQTLLCGGLVPGYAGSSFTVYQPYIQTVTLPAAEGDQKLAECIEAENAHPWRDAALFDRYQFALFVRGVLQQKFEECLSASSVVDERICVDDGVTEILERAAFGGYDLPNFVGTVGPMNGEISALEAERRQYGRAAFAPIATALETDSIIFGSNVFSDVDSDGRVFFLSPLLGGVEEVDLVSARLIGLRGLEQLLETLLTEATGETEGLADAIAEIGSNAEYRALFPLVDVNSIDNPCRFFQGIEWLGCLRERIAGEIDREKETVPELLVLDDASFAAVKSAFCSVSPAGMLMRDCVSAVSDLELIYEEVSAYRERVLQGSEDSSRETHQRIMEIERRAVASAGYEYCAGGFSSLRSLRIYECLFSIAIRMHAELPMRKVDFRDEMSLVPVSLDIEGQWRAQLLSDAADMGRLIFSERLGPLYDLICLEQGLAEFCASRGTYSLGWASYGPGLSVGDDSSFCRPTIYSSFWGRMGRGKTGERYVLEEELQSTRRSIQQCSDHPRMVAAPFIMR